MPRTKNDSFFKRSLEDPAIAKAFFIQHLPEHLKPLVDFKALKRMDRSSTDDKLKQRHRDVVYEAPIEDSYTLLACTEHQGKPERMMLVRLLRYDADAIEFYMQKHQRWPVIVNIVFTQAASWPYPSAAQDHYELPALGSQELSMRYHLVEIQKFSDKEVLSHGLCAPMELLIKHSESSNFELEPEAYRPVFQACIDEVGEDYLETMLAYAVSLSHKETGQQMLNFISEVLIDKKDIIMTYGQQLRQEGMQIRSLEIAKNMLWQLHLGMDVVQKATGLSREELERIKTQAGESKH
ncbi:MAG: Rpn family recombination-promoting nuclease/putative transposase [Roseivirga sp.]